MKKILLALLLIALFAPPPNAKAAEIRISKQYGISHFLLNIVEERKLIEKYAEAAGIKNLEIKWLTLGSGSSTNDAFLSGNVDVISLGVGPFVRLWDRTKGQVKGIAAIDQAPLKLNTSKAEIKKLMDFSDKDRIAVPAGKVSMPALILQLAVAKELGIKNYDKLDYLTVSSKHPDAAVAITSGKSEITGHVASEPFSTIELNTPSVHTIFNSYDVLGGNHIFNIVATSQSFYDKNPELTKVVLLAMDEACQWVTENTKEAAEMYIAVTKTKEPPELIHEIFKDPQIVYSTTPVRIALFSDFLYETGAVKNKAASWKDLFFDPIHDRPGS